MLIKTKQHFPCLYRSKLVYDFIKVSLLFRPFLFSSKLYHITFPDLLLINEARKYERTSFSLLKDCSQLPVNTVSLPSSALFAKQFEECLEDLGRDKHFRCRVNSSGSQKAADSNVALRMNISAPVRSSDSAKISKNVASLVDCTRKKIFCLGGAGCL